jgi:hypothetical protein
MIDDRPYLSEQFFGFTRAELDARFVAMASGFQLCFDRRLAEAVIVSRAAGYGVHDDTSASIPLTGCDFTGEIGNIIVALSGRCSAAEKALEDAYRLIAYLRSQANVSK